MNIFISQIEVIRPTRKFVFDALERAYYTLLSKHNLIPVPNSNIVPDNDYDCLVLTGGPDSVARNKTENLLYEDAFKKGKPIVGICHGAFVINDICGGVNGYIDNHVDKEHTIKMYDKEYNVRCYHTQRIEKLPKDFIAIAYDLEGNPEAFKHKTLPIYGMLWHPERMENPVLPPEVKKLLD